MAGCKMTESSNGFKDQLGCRTKVQSHLVADQKKLPVLQIVVEVVRRADGTRSNVGMITPALANQDPTQPTTSLQMNGFLSNDMFYRIRYSSRYLIR